MSRRDRVCAGRGVDADVVDAGVDRQRLVSCRVAVRVCAESGRDAVTDEQPFVARPPGLVEDVVAAAEEAARHWGLPAPQLLRMGMNGTFAAGDEVVLRVSRPSAPAEQALWLAGELARHGVRVPAAVARRRRRGR